MFMLHMPEYDVYTPSNVERFNVERFAVKLILFFTLSEWAVHRDQL